MGTTYIFIKKVIVMIYQMVTSLYMVLNGTVDNYP